ncbi:MAG: hypothetical protein N839_0006260 [Desulfofustis sp. PB-SRB1]|jgi:ABC-type transporter Mla subunit MlaD|nr:hypothetical protein [Desulfofustis sp. PB-SRB1]MBM1002002.1 hypothetical protein [Desulfofustis sp. PB-SRB1]HBH31210.1 hypothetical protein [Desulfofustis sp.]
MAQIKSTLELVMERADRLAADVADTPEQYDKELTGVRLAAAFLNDQSTPLSQTLKEHPAADQMQIRKGMATTLLRNIVLPRDGEISSRSLLSLRNLPELAGKSRDISAICKEIKQILEQYRKHLDQVKEQFDQSILQQLKMQLQQQGLAVADELSLNPAMHPQYQEEWSRVLTDLNSQYEEALEQRKNQIAQRF